MTRSAWRPAQWVVTSDDLAKRGAEALRDPITRFFARVEYYRTDLTDLHTLVDGEVGLAWGTWDEIFKPTNGPPEKAHVRFTETYKRDGTTWRSVLYHRDIEPFGADGRYRKQLTTVSAPRPIPASPQASEGETDLARHIRRVWRNWNSQNLDSIIPQSNHAGIGYGWRTPEWRTSQFDRLSDADLAKTNGEILRARLQRSFASWDSYHVEITELHTKVDGDLHRRDARDGDRTG